MSDSNGYGGRGAHGRFAPGNQHAAGNPNAKRMHEYRKSLLEAGDDETLKKVFRKLGEMALAGDTTAAKIYIEYLCGRPTQGIELTGADGESLIKDPLVQVERILETLSHEQLQSFQELTELFNERQKMLEGL